MIKSWLISTMAPFYGTDQYYAAYAEDEEKLRDWLYANWFDGECQNLYDSYGYKWEDQYEEEYDEIRDDFEDYDAFLQSKFDEWCQDCSLKIEECPEEDFSMYVAGGEGELEVVYDERT